MPNLENLSFFSHIHCNKVFPLLFAYTQKKGSHFFSSRSIPHACASSSMSEKLDRNNFFFMFPEKECTAQSIKEKKKNAEDLLAVSFCGTFQHEKFFNEHFSL